MSSKLPAPPQKPVSVLFVCLGNICRSTMAEGVFRSLTSQRSPPSPAHPLIAKIDSCGTGAYHVGSSPDSRTLAVLHSHGIQGYKHSARKFRAEDFQEFDFVFAMDEDNLEDLKQVRKRAIRAGNVLKVDEMGRVMLFGEFGGKGSDEEIGDPYYGGTKGFDAAYEQVQRFSKGFLKYLEDGKET